MRNILLIVAAAVLPLLFWPSKASTAPAAEITLPADGVITLEQAIQIALRNNRTLVSSGLGVTSSDLALKSQKAQFDIQVKPQGSAGYHSNTDTTWQVGAAVSKKISSGGDLVGYPLGR